MYLSTISEWLDWIASLHPQEIELGLERVQIVAARLNVLEPLCPVIIIGGTNGKGSCVEGISTIYRVAGYKVGTFTSPFVFKHNEEVRINGQMASDAAFCEAFSQIEVAREGVSLTPFEYHTLAALLILKAAVLDVWVLEVGLGGRLDAVNIIDADVSVVSSIGLDHQAYLGDTREQIAYEKAGIFRAQQLAVCGDTVPPTVLIDRATALKTKLYIQAKDFSYTQTPIDWSWRYNDVYYPHLPIPKLAIHNMSTVLMVITLLQNKLPVSREAIEKGLVQAQLIGRLQSVPGNVTEIYDVGHNPQAVTWLANYLQQQTCSGKTYAVFSMLADKDITQSIKTIADYIDAWFVAPLTAKRAATQKQLAKEFANASVSKTKLHFASDIQTAYHIAKKQAKTGDRLVIFGSFRTVAEVMQYCHPAHA